MHTPLLAGDVAIMRSRADHPAPDFARRRSLDVPSADICVWAAANGHLMSANRLARKSRRLNPIRTCLGLVAPNQRR